MTYETGKLKMTPIEKMLYRIWCSDREKTYIRCNEVLEQKDDGFFNTSPILKEMEAQKLIKKPFQDRFFLTPKGLKAVGKVVKEYQKYKKLYLKCNNSLSK